jgi:hypothetical protein
MRSVRPVLIGSISLLAVFAWCGLGFAYWTDVASVTFTASSGTLGGALVHPVSTDPEGHRDPGQDLDVACTEPGRVSDDHLSFPVTISNAYAGYTAEVLFAFENTGTIPEKVSSLSVDSVPVCPDAPLEIDLDGDGIEDLGLTCEGLYVGQVIKVGEQQPATLSFTVYGDGTGINDESPAVTGTFTFVIDLMQWNVPLPGE